MRCLGFLKITEILLFKEMNLFTYRDITQSIGCSKTTVGDVLSRRREYGLTYANASGMTQDEVNQFIYPESFGPKQVKEKPDWEYLHAKLRASRKINLHYIWENDYRPNHTENRTFILSIFTNIFNSISNESSTLFNIPSCYHVIIAYTIWWNPYIKKIFGLFSANSIIFN